MAKLINQLFKGAWSGATAYTIGDIVVSNGSSYVCIANHTNHVPPNATYWTLVASAGEDGTDGANGTNGADGLLTAATSAEVNTGSSNTKSVTPSNLKASIYFNAPQGFMINGKIVTSIASNDLVVAIKTLAGNNPSATDPVYVRIGNTVRSITAALSVTLADGTNWMNLGSTEHATQDVDLFAYLGYNATDGVVLGCSRIPYARKYGDFSATSTNEKYAAISTIATAGSSDEYELIGRFNATLSGSGTSYLWTIPATSIIINRPIFRTRWLTWVPTLTGFSANPTSVVYNYQLIDRICYVNFIQGANGTSNATGFTATFPFSCTNISNFFPYFATPIIDGGSGSATPGLIQIQTNSNTVNFFKDFNFTAWTGSGGKRAVGTTMFYPID